MNATQINTDDTIGEPVAGNEHSHGSEAEAAVDEELISFELGKSRRDSLKLLKFTLPVVIISIIVASSLYFWPYITEPRPPGEDVVGSYNGKYITIDDLKENISLEQAREWEHAYCEIHGYNHEECDPSEPCEMHPIDSLEGYRQVVKNLAMERIILDWAADKDITGRDDVQHGLKDLLDDASVGRLIDQIHERELTAESIPKWEVQQYYDENLSVYGNREFSEVEHEIRDLLVARKDEEYFPQYIEELKKSSGLEVNFELLKISEPTNDEITTYYNQNISNYEIPETAEILEIKIESDATEAVRKLGSGESFESVAEAYGIGGKAEKRTLQRGSGETELESAVWALSVDEISDPITTSDGSTSIAKLNSITPSGKKPLSEVRDEIATTLRLENMEREYTLRKDEALFSVHSKRYTLGDFYREFLELPESYQMTFSTYDTKKELLEQFIAKELLLEEVGDATSNDKDQHGFEELKIQYLSRIIHQDEVEGKLTDPSDEEMLQFYEENKDKLVITARAKISLIWIDEGAGGEKKEQALQKANEALSLIKSGTDFAEVAKMYSEDGTATIGGEISEWLYQDHLPFELGDSIFSLSEGELSNVIESGNGLYIIKVREKKERQTMTYEDSVDIIKEHLMSEKHEQLEAELEKNLIENANLIIYDRTLRKLIKSKSK